MKYESIRSWEVLNICIKARINHLNEIFFKEAQKMDGRDDDGKNPLFSMSSIGGDGTKISQ
jgi:hypothetical protein